MPLMQTLYKLDHIVYRK